ncbi:MAG: HAD family hydrolase [Alphaproteobacteria bacterium]
MSCVLVDLDGTLLSGPSSERLFIVHLVRRGTIGGRGALAALRFYLRYRRRFGPHVWKKNKAYLAGLDAAFVERSAERFAVSQLLPRVRPAMRRRIEDHRRAGDAVALLTGAPEFLAGPLARALAIEQWSAARLALEGGWFRDSPPLAHPFGEEKVIRAEELCGRMGCTLADATAYADSVHDLPLLARVGRAVAVAPDRALARAAEGRGWEILPG